MLHPRCLSFDARDMDDIDPTFNPCAEDTPGLASHLK
jgi:hypothetical protein